MTKYFAYCFLSKPGVGKLQPTGQLQLAKDKSAAHEHVFLNRNLNGGGQGF